jgi:NAD(P)-dependent dehydrogenase (short-subunit alcohol dehydrogenase family)
VRAFAPVLAAGGGAIVNMLSETSLASYHLDPSYSVSKAAEWSLTNAIRMKLSGQGALAVGVHARFIDTDVAAGLDVPKISPESVADTTRQVSSTGNSDVPTVDVVLTAAAFLVVGPLDLPCRVMAATVTVAAPPRSHVGSLLVASSWSITPFLR